MQIYYNWGVFNSKHDRRLSKLIISMKKSSSMLLNVLEKETKEKERKRKKFSKRIEKKISLKDTYILREKPK